MDFYGMTPFTYGPPGAADRFLNQISAKLSATRTYRGIASFKVATPSFAFAA